MQRVARYYLLVLAILLAGAAAASAQEVTVIQLLQSPRQFVERRVSVSGYYYCDFESQILYADRAAAERHDFSRSIWVDSEPPVKSELRPAHVIGVFRHESKMRYGIFGLWKAQIINATIHLGREPKKAPNHAMQPTTLLRCDHTLTLPRTLGEQQSAPPRVVADLESR